MSVVFEMSIAGQIGLIFLAVVFICYLVALCTIEH